MNLNQKLVNSVVALACILLLLLVCMALESRGKLIESRVGIIVAVVTVVVFFVGAFLKYQVERNERVNSDSDKPSKAPGKPTKAAK